ncbi:TetR/AcrR family transcriptional regulator [Anaeroselena agilis]|uniref:Helix-turn-helix domain-containing protein n=1 Tax=Anaeroselena agilis TaxID=3063788 RepID=A0ABU3NSP3_9FIRM|nr:helix-turn-helix domain-containing protein [Selenomonadales bacterium 4137-cl]
MLGLPEHSGKKGEMLYASLELFATRGYDAVSVRDIAKAAGVSEAALYKHFAGKEDMALFIFGGIISEYTARLKAVAAGPEGAVAKLGRIVDVTYELYREYPAEIRFALLSQYLFWDKVAEEIKPHFVIRRIIADGMDSGEIPRREVYLWIAIFSGVMLQPLAQHRYFADVLPGMAELKVEIKAVVRKLFAVE